MDKFNMLKQIKDIYENKSNIIEYLKTIDDRNYNTIEDIMISYDFQAGTYIEYYERNKEFIQKYCYHLAKVIDGLGTHKSLLEVGVGEATTLGTLLLSLRNKPLEYYGFDISWSRLKYAKKFLNKLGLNTSNLFMADLFCIPLKDNSIDIVYTSHSIEPNGGREEEALAELYRITNKYLILLEPAYELASHEARNRMIKHGYVTDLYNTVKKLGYNVIEYRLFELNSNSLNPTGIMIIEKKACKEIKEPMCCPITKTSLEKFNNCYYSAESYLLYPVIDNIPCLLSQNAILATKFSQ